MKKYIYLQFLLVALSLVALLYVAFQERTYIETEVAIDPGFEPSEEIDAAAGQRPGIVDPGLEIAEDPPTTFEEGQTSGQTRTETVYRLVPDDRGAPEGASTARPGSVVRPLGETQDGQSDGDSETVYR